MKRSHVALIVLAFLMAAAYVGALTMIGGGGAGGAPGNVTSVFGRIGDVVKQAGDYSAADVTNAADVTTANTFTNAAGQTVRQISIGTAPNVVTLQVPGTGFGNQIVKLPGAGIDLTTTGGTSQFLRQNTLGGALSVVQPSLSDLTGSAGLTLNVTPATCTADPQGGKLTVVGTEVRCAADQGGAGGPGDITDVGTCAGPGACFTDTTPSARLTHSTSAAPASPSAGRVTVYADSTSNTLASKNAAGTVTHGVQTVTATAGQFLASIADDGSSTKVAPTKADVGLGNVDNTSDATKNSATVALTNKQIVPRVVQLVPAANVITPNADNTDVGYNFTLAASTTIANPTATVPNPRDQQSLEFAFRTAAPQSLIWGSAYSTTCGLPLPDSTTGDGVTYNHFLFVYHTDTTVWCLVASTRAPSNRVTTTTVSTTTTTFNCQSSLNDRCEIRLQGGAGAVTVPPPGGAPNNGDMLLYAFLCTASNTIAWDAIFIASPNVPLPVVCNADTSRWTVAGMQYSSILSKWQILGSN